MKAEDLRKEFFKRFPKEFPNVLVNSMDYTRWLEQKLISQPQGEKEHVLQPIVKLTEADIIDFWKQAESYSEHEELHMMKDFQNYLISHQPKLIGVTPMTDSEIRDWMNTSSYLMADTSDEEIGNFRIFQDYLLTQNQPKTKEE